MDYLTVPGKHSDLRPKFENAEKNSKKYMNTFHFKLTVEEMINNSIMMFGVLYKKLVYLSAPSVVVVVCLKSVWLQDRGFL